LEIIIHRINTIRELHGIEPKYGTEIDIRADGSDLVLNHEPFQGGEKLFNYLDNYHHGTLILNIKEAGIENEVLNLVRERTQINSYFLLDVEFPYLYQASRKNEKNIAVRFSEDESIKTVENYVDMVDWVWIDTITQLPITIKNISILNQFKKCLVCPERWNRPEDIKNYKKEIYNNNFKLDAVMTSIDFAELWLK